MNRMLLYKKIYLRRSLSLAVCFTVLFVAYSAVSVYLETAAAYGEALASLKEPQQLSFSVRMLYGGARIFLLILFLAIGAYSHADKIRQSRFLFRFGYSRFRIFRVNACVTFLELLIPDLLAAGLYAPVSRWIFRYFQEQYQFDAAGSTEALRLLQPVLALYYGISLICLSARCR